MAENRSQTLRSMSLTQLRKEAVSRGIKGLSKAPRETVYAAIRSHCAPMDNYRRTEVYAAQRGICYGSRQSLQRKPRNGMTPAQYRRWVKAENRAKGRA